MARISTQLNTCAMLTASCAMPLQNSSAVAEMEDLVEESAVRFMRDWDTRGEIREMGRAAEAVRLREQHRTFGAFGTPVRQRPRCDRGDDTRYR